jgi:hypothetical protein
VDAFFGFADLALVFFGMGNILVVDSSNINELLAVCDWLLALFCPPRGGLFGNGRTANREQRKADSRLKICPRGRSSAKNTSKIKKALAIFLSQVEKALVPFYREQIF